MGRLRALSVRDVDELEWYFGRWDGVGCRSPFGGQLEAARLGLGKFTRYDPEPAYMLDSFAMRKGRRVAVRLTEANKAEPRAAEVLSAYYGDHGIACDGLVTKRILSVYPLTVAARNAKDKQGRLLITRSGRTPGNALRELNARRAQAKRAERATWAEIESEARDLLQSAVEAYHAVGRTEKEKKGNRWQLSRARFLQTA